MRGSNRSVVRGAGIGIAAVLAMVLTAACGSPPQPAASPTAHYGATPKKQSAKPAPTTQFCTITFATTAYNAVQGLGFITAVVKGPHDTQTDRMPDLSNAGGRDAICATPGNPTTVTLSESPTARAKAFLGWTISGDGGKYNDTTIKTPTFTFTLIGNTSVKANYSR